MKRRLTVLIAAALVLALMPTCSGAFAAAEAEVYNLEMLVHVTGQMINEYSDNAIRDKMAEDIGVRFQLIECDTDKFNLMLSSDDLPDIIRSPLSYTEQLMLGEKVIPMDPYLEEYAPDILANLKDVMAFSREFWSNGTGNLYFLPHALDIGEIGPDRVYENGLSVRWDLWKAIGYPMPKNADDIIDIVKRMVEVQPVTEDGQKVYGFATNVDFGALFWQSCWMNFDNVAWWGGPWVDGTTKEYISQFTDERGRLSSIEFWFKANQEGLVDPDSLTQTYTDRSAKYATGRAVASSWNWGVGNWNEINATTDKKIMILPLEFGFLGTFGYNRTGWTDRFYDITKNCKNPEKTMQFINYVFSYDGARNMYSGVEGVHWDMIDGAPTLRDEVIDMWVSGGEERNLQGFFALPGNLNYVGLGNRVIHSDGYPINLFIQPSLFKRLNDVTEAEYCEHFGVDFPADAYNISMKKNGLASSYDFDSRVSALWPTDPDDIARIYANLDDLYSKQGAKMLLAADRAEFDALKADLLKQAEEMGVAAYDEYMQKTLAGVLQIIAELDAR